MMYAVEMHDRLEALADPTRLMIPRLLAEPVASCCRRDDGVRACEVAAFLGLAQPTVSHPMNPLVDGGFVTAERRDRWVYDELAAPAFDEVVDELRNVRSYAPEPKGVA
jgi:ArsR family transcriptional regulator